MKLHEIHRMLHALSKEGYVLISTPRQDHEQAQGDQPKPYESGDSSLRQAPLIIDVKQPPKGAQNTKPKWYNNPKWWKAAFQFTVGIAGIGYAIVTYFQWRDLQHNFRVDERAWIRISPQTPESPFEDLNTVSSSVQIVNEGKLPARMVYVSSIVEIVKSEQGSSLNLYGRPSQGATIGVVFPRQVEKFTFNMPVSMDRPDLLPITIAEKEDLKSGKSFLVTFGRAEYVDDFGPHWTQFCWWRAFSRNVFYKAAGCSAYGAVDETR